MKLGARISPSWRLCLTFLAPVLHLADVVHYERTDPNLANGVQNCTPLAEFPESGVEHYERAKPNLASGVQNCTPFAKFLYQDLPAWLDVLHIILHGCIPARIE